MFSWKSPAHSCLIWKVLFSLSKSCPLRESPTKKSGKKTQFCFLGGCSGSSPEVASGSSPKRYNWAHTQLVADTSSSLTYRLFKLFALVWACEFSCLFSSLCPKGLEDSPRSCFAQNKPIILLFPFGLIWAYCVIGETYYPGTENLLLSVKVEQRRISGHRQLTTKGSRLGLRGLATVAIR